MQTSFSGPFYHGTYNLEIGQILNGRGAEYELDWIPGLKYYRVLHDHRPEDCTPHHLSVFMCDNIDDIDSCGGSTDRVALLLPKGPVTRHDLNWTTRIGMLISQGVSLEDPQIIEACEAYWSGQPSCDPLWEYLAGEAEVLAIEDYADMEAEAKLLAFWPEAIEP